MALGVARELKRKYFNHARVFIFVFSDWPNGSDVIVGKIAQVAQRRRRVVIVVIEAVVVH